MGRDEELLQLYDGEVEAVDAQIAVASAHLRDDLLLAVASHKQSGGDMNVDGRDAILELAPGVGGQEAALFTAEMWEMYKRCAESRGWDFEQNKYEEMTGGGLLSAGARISGSADFESCGPFGWLRWDSGVHRVQRIPETDRKGRMQTSSATVVVMPVAEEKDVVLNPGDLRIEISKKSSGPGGQSVNAAHQAVRATHLPSGFAVHVSMFQTRQENHVRALAMLRSKILAKSFNERSEFERTSRRQQRGSGDRSEKIRTYNFQHDVVTDHRLTEQGSHSATEVLEGGGLQAILDEHRAVEREFAVE